MKKNNKPRPIPTLLNAIIQVKATPLFETKVLTTKVIGNASHGKVRGRS